MLILQLKNSSNIEQWHFRVGNNMQFLNQCPKCKSTVTLTIKIHNPETQDMNADAILQCEDCKHIWEDIVASPYTEEQYKLGWII